MTSFRNLEKLRPMQRLRPLQNGQCESKIKIVKSMGKTCLETRKHCSTQKNGFKHHLIFKK